MSEENLEMRAGELLVLKTQCYSDKTWDLYKVIKDFNMRDALKKARADHVYEHEEGFVDYLDTCEFVDYLIGKDFIGGAEYKNVHIGMNRATLD